MKKVLVVDDNPVNLQVLEEMLSGDYRLKFARDGAEAIEIAAAFQPAIILLDVMLPGVDGLTVCRRLRRLPGVSRSAIIMVSAKAMPSEEAEGLAAGADEYITKPFDENELIELLRAYEDAPSEGATLSGDLWGDAKGLAAF
jgi:putative two-component system response regulator